MPNDLAPTLSRVMQIDDVLDTGSHRQFLFLPFTPDGGDGSIFSMMAVNIQIPSVRLGHIRVNLYGQTRAFRGQRDHGNMFNVSAHDVKGGPITYMLLNWMELCASSRDDSGMVQYMIDVPFYALDSTGETAYQFMLRNVWPQQVTPAASTEQSAPARVECVMSVDFVDLVAGGMLPNDLKGFMRDKPWRGPSSISVAASLLDPAAIQGGGFFPASSEAAFSLFERLINA